MNLPRLLPVVLALLLLGFVTQDTRLVASGGFPKVADGAPQDEDPMDPRWDKYHTTAETHALLEAWADTFPQLTSLFSIGETLNGTPLVVLEVTNEETGDALDKPAYYYDGNIHAGELTGGEVALHFAWVLLSNYGKEPDITSIVDTRTLYIRPKFNPDGADIALTSEQVLRSTPRPYDQDRDGLLDEDPPDDLDGDGHITQMRVPDPDGEWMISSVDPRLMVRRAETEAGGQSATARPDSANKFYDLISEGIDNDDDGRFNEDGIGGIDMNRNFPRNWGREFEQRGAGPYPLSEPETRATIEFFESHRNITGIFHGHTSGGFAYRLPSTTAWDNFAPADQALILEQSRMYEEITEQPALPSYTDPEVHRHGTLISWGYWDFGVVGFVPEFWGGFGEDYNFDGEISPEERLQFMDARFGDRYFTDWAPYDHPELGAVEIGGLHRKFTVQNPPPSLLERELELYVPWMLWLAKIAPQVEIRGIHVAEQRATSGPGQADRRPTTEPQAGATAGDVFNLSVDVVNVGYLPTNLTQRALDAEIAVPVRVILDLEDADLVEGSLRTDIGHLLGLRDTGDSLPTVAAETITFSDPRTRGSVRYLLRARGPNPIVNVTVVSEKGGTHRRRVRLTE